jgi:23S rRNA (adenine2503-C2)-methyltransferase
MTSPVALQAVLPDELASAHPGVDVAEARKLVSCVHRHGALPRHAPPGVRRGTLERVREAGHVPALEVVARQASALDPFVKYALRTSGGTTIETVRIPLEVAGRFSVCVSSQAGCALACAFCATGRMGLARNLEAWEIVEQIRVVRGELPPGTRVHGVVFQGMGEPLANLDHVIRAVRVLSEPSAQAIDQRAITICTSGLPTGIRRLARELPRVRLGVSLGSARPGRRASLMPIDRAHPLSEVMAAAAEHAAATGHAPMFAYTLLAGVNDDAEDAGALAALVRDFADRCGVRPRLSLIPYNAIGADDPFARAGADRETAFRDALAAAGAFATRRYSGGADVGAACGQLALRGVG